MSSVDANWESSRSYIFSALLKSQAVPLNGCICFICEKNTAVLRCHQCGPRILICSVCDEKIHKKNPLHDRDVWMNGFFQEIPPTASVSDDGSLAYIGVYI